MLSSLLTLGTAWTFVGGKGGVGKTTVAASLAVALADEGADVLVLSVDPAHSLGDALGVALGPEPAAVAGVPGLRALEIDAAREQARFLGSHRGALLQLLDRGTYLDGPDIESLVDLALPGADELAALFRLMELASDGSARVVVDTAPTGHTLRLLELPTLARSWLAALGAMEEKSRAVSLALVGAYRPGEAAALIGSLEADLDRVDAMLADPTRTRFALVTNPQPVVLAETRRYEEALTARGIALAGVVVNRSGPDDAPAVGPGMVFIPPLPTAPRGPDGLRGFAAAASAGPAGASASGSSGTSSPPVEVGGPFLPPTDRDLYLVGGKGGVGKSTAACALAIQLAERGAGRVLLLGADPAGSLGDLLGMEVGPEPRPVPGVAGLEVQQMDAGVEWAEFRREYRAEAERLFAGLVTGGSSADADRRVVARLVDLAPPGIDELMTLLQVVDLTEDRPYDALVLDTAPTGHLLRLLELPALGLDWTHALLRMLLRYREVLGLGQLAERVLEVSRDLRGLTALLQDPARCWVLAIALPESLSVPETARLLERLRALGIAPGALLLNRLLDEEGRPAPGAADEAAALLRVAAGLPCAAAPAHSRGPAGAAELAAFAAEWRLTAMNYEL